MKLVITVLLGIILLYAAVTGDRNLCRFGRIKANGAGFVVLRIIYAAAGIVLIAAAMLEKGI